MATVALDLEMIDVTKRFGGFVALDGVSLRAPRGSFHALLGENGAGKSTLVKCLVGYQLADSGQVIVDARERDIRTPQQAHAIGIGMVYQHFTLVPCMSVAENLVMARAQVPMIIDWRREREALEDALRGLPFRVPLDVPVANLAAGEKQKVEILKQLYLGRRLLILDEPTSVLTPAEADEVLGYLKGLTRAGALTVLMITHKFREVMAFADAVTVLRRGRVSGTGSIPGLDVADLGALMVGTREGFAGAAEHASPAAPPARLGDRPALEIRALEAEGDNGLPAVRSLSLQVRPGEIVGIAGVSGNGQRELVQTLIGQRQRVSGAIQVGGVAYRATRAQMRALGVSALPEEPLGNACVREMSVAENMALRSFDRPPLAAGGLWLRRREFTRQARQLISDYKVKTRGPEAPIGTLSGGNVQRAVLARELSRKAAVLIVANPVFGLDFAAVAEIHQRLRKARDEGTAVLMVSEDLDELLEVSDRLLVMFNGRIVHETPTALADVGTIGRHMAGHAGMESSPSTQTTASSQ